LHGEATLRGAGMAQTGLGMKKEKFLLKIIINRY
jgi:hypothetical protein